MRKVTFAVGSVMMVLGLPIASYYASYFLTFNSTTGLTFPPDVVARFQLTEVLGASLALLGAILVVGSLVRTSRRKIV